jgi:hypothetical protein
MPAMRPDFLDEPHPRRLSPTHPWRAEILARHRQAIAERRPTYRDPVSGFSVFTAAVLADRGTCCESGCRHCPYVGADDGVTG